MIFGRSIICLFSCACLFSCSTDDSLVLETHKPNLEYSTFLEHDLAGLGLLDLTKLSEVMKSEIEEMEIIRYANFPSTYYDAQIIIIDANRNGKFEYDSVDMIGLTSFNEKLNFQAINFEKSNKPLVIKIEDQNYELLIYEGNSQIELIKREGSYDLTYPYQLPNTNPQRLTKGAMLNKENGKYTYVEFWGTWCKPCLKIVPEVKKLKEEFGDQLNVVGINYRDKDLDRVKKCIIRYKMNWDHVVADSILLSEFGNPHFVPCGILFDPNGYLVEYGVSVKDVRELLSSKE